MSLVSELKSQIIDRKDMMSYLDFRIKQLQHNLDELYENDNQIRDTKIPAVMGELKGRKKELRRLRRIVNDREVKEEAKDTWEYLFERDLIGKGKEKESQSEFSELFELTNGDYMTEEDLKKRAEDLKNYSKECEENE